MESEQHQSSPTESKTAAAHKHREPLRHRRHYRKTKAFFKTLGLLVLFAALLALAWFLGTRM